MQLDNKTLPLIKLLPDGQILLSGTEKTSVFVQLSGAPVPHKAPIQWLHRPEVIGMLWFVSSPWSFPSHASTLSFALRLLFPVRPFHLVAIGRGRSPRSGYGCPRAVLEYSESRGV